MGYTWRQFTAYLQQARRRQAQRRLDRAADVRAAVHGGDSAAGLARALGAIARG